MPLHCLRIPNVYVISLKPHVRALQTVAQLSTTASHNISLSTLKTQAEAPRLCQTPSIKMDTDILAVDPTKLGKISLVTTTKIDDLVDEWDIEYDEGPDAESIARAAKEIITTDTPVAFPTETVYGLGADATRGSAVRAIFAAKGRPADNPLIVHVHSMAQLRSLLSGKEPVSQGTPDSVPEIYKPLIRKFWPGPLTIILPNPIGSVLAPEVTAGLDTFGARMPRSILALALIKSSGVPLAAPSANASTRPSPTAAEHVKDDLHGRIRTIIDGGPCEVGVESTVVDGLTDPPSILRPGGITVEQLRQCPGWEDVVVGYKDARENASRPRAPGMKYRHYSPKATVILFEAGAQAPNADDLRAVLASSETIGVIRTKVWPMALGLPFEHSGSKQRLRENGVAQNLSIVSATALNGSRENPSLSNLLRSVIQHQIPHAEHYTVRAGVPTPVQMWEVNLGPETEGVARGLFSALRELDKKGVDVIFVEGIDDNIEDDIAAAIMNRLRKAAEIRK